MGRKIAVTGGEWRATNSLPVPVQLALLTEEESRCSRSAKRGEHSPYDPGGDLSMPRAVAATIGPGASGVEASRSDPLCVQKAECDFSICLMAGARIERNCGGIKRFLVQIIDLCANMALRFFRAMQRGFMKPRLLFSLAFAAFFAAQLTWAQNDAAISGTVQDSSGASIPRAAVKLQSHEQGTIRNAESNQAGVYQFSFLPSGTYDLEVSGPGFKTLTRTNIVLAVAQNLRLDVTLEVGAVSENVTVEANAAAVNTASGDLGAVIDNTRVIEMPLNGRLFWSLAELTPGVAPPAQGSSLGYRGGLNVLGSCEGCNNFMVNGFDNNNSTTSVPNFRPTIDAIEEFNILTGIFPAQYGYGSGGQIIVTTKSGTNQFHGVAYDFLRNQVMDTRNFFSAPGAIPSFKRNQFGGTVGGPIKKDRTFFFYSYEGLRLGQQEISLTTVPTLAMRTGDFSALLPKTVIKDPTTGLPFAGNIIPPTRLSPIGVALADVYPAPTFATAAGGLPNNNYDFTGIRPENYNEDSLKIDHTFSAKDSMYATANWYNDIAYEHGSGTSCTNTDLPQFSCFNELRAELYGISETHIFSPTMVNEARIGADLIWLPEIPTTSGINFWGQYGINPLSPLTPITRLPYLGYPTLAVTGYAGYGSNKDFYFHQPNWQYTDALSMTRGKHTIKVGFNLVHFASNTENLGNNTGTLNFTNSSTGPTSGNGMADLLLGIPASTTNSPYNYEWYVRAATLSAYIQDDYKVNSRLTLNLGLRWELNTPAILLDNHETSFNPTTGQAVTQANPAPFAPGGAIVVGFSGNHVYNYDWHDYAPRLGFAWQPFKDGKTVIRGGAGTFFNNTSIFNSGISTAYSGVPYAANYTYTSSLTQPVLLSNPFPTSDAVTTNSPAGIAQAFRNPRVYEWSTGVQRQLAQDMTLEVTYFGSVGNHLGVTQNINQPAPGPGTPAQVNARRPYPAYGTVSFYEWDGNSRFNSMQVNLRKRYRYGLSFLATYQYSHSIDDLGAYTNQYNFRTGLGSSTFDIRHHFVISPVWELPFGPGRQFVTQGVWSKIVGGWQVSPLFTFGTGTPLTATLSGNYSNSGGSTDRPNIVCNPNANAPNSPQEWFNTSCFQIPIASGQPGAPYSFGNEGRGVIFGPGVVNLDISIVRMFVIRERAKLQFRFESFDSLNHPLFGLPGLVANTSSFATITSTTTNSSGNRQNQVALKLVF
jgi:hypothetical protein